MFVLRSFLLARVCFIILFYSSLMLSFNILYRIFEILKSLRSFLFRGVSHGGRSYKIYPDYHLIHSYNQQHYYCRQKNNDTDHSSSVNPSLTLILSQQHYKNSSPYP